TPEVRARRRAADYKAQGRGVGEAEVLADIRNRDQRDHSRSIAPLKQAPDAHLLDTTHLDIDAAIRAAIDIVEASRAGRGRAEPPSGLKAKPRRDPQRKARLRTIVPKARFLRRPSGIPEAAVGLRDLRPARLERHSNRRRAANRRLHGHRYSTLA